MFMYTQLTKFSVLMVEDDRQEALSFQEKMHGIESTEYPQVTVGVCHTLYEARSALLENKFDIILLDLFLPDSHDLKGLELLIKQFPRVPVVVHSGIYSAKLSAEAIAIGAQDYIVKGTMCQEDLIRTLVHAKRRQDILNDLRELGGAFDR